MQISSTKDLAKAINYVDVDFKIDSNSLIAANQFNTMSHNTKCNRKFYKNFLHANNKKMLNVDNIDNFTNDSILKNCYREIAKNDKYHFLKNIGSNDINHNGKYYKNMTENNQKKSNSINTYKDTIKHESIKTRINCDFFVRIILAGLEIIKLLRVQDSLLHEPFGIGAGGDCSSGADLLAEAVFRKFLLPKYNLESEESGILESDIKSSYTIVLDPLDGSSNFQSNIPYYGASLALCDESGKVCEACVINYVSREIAYINDSLLTTTNIPCIFTLDSVGLYIPFTLLESSPKYLTSSSGLPYQPIDFSPLFNSRACGDFAANPHIAIKRICDTIVETKKYLPKFNDEFMYKLFQHKVIERKFEPNYSASSLKCGIFEKASHFPEWVTILLQYKLKFRSLGATALSLGFSFRYLFVLLPTSVRKYDGMAGFYLAQNQYIKGNVGKYLQAIPSMKRYINDKEYIIISVNPQIVDILCQITSHHQKE